MTYGKNSYSSEQSIIRDADVPALIFGFAFGTIVLAHSYHMHKLTSFKIVRVISDISAIALILQCMTFYICSKTTIDSVAARAVVQNVFGFGLTCLTIEICDVYLTFARYVVVAGGAIKLYAFHKHVTFAYFSIFLVLTWFPFYTKIPLFANVNSSGWDHLHYIFGWVFFVSYVLFDMCYSGLVIYKLMMESSSNEKLNILGINALGHTCCSIMSCFMNSFYNSSAFATTVQSILIVFGIHGRPNTNIVFTIFHY